MNLQEFVDHFPGEKKRIGDKLFCLCPAHNDHDPSLEITLGQNNKRLVHCFAGCQTESVLRAAGLQWRDLDPDGDSDTQSADEVPFADWENGTPKTPAPHRNGRPKPKVVANYDYYNEFGELVLRVQRLEPKSFRQCRPDPKKADGWIYNTKDVRRVPYNLPKIMNASIQDAVIFVEGEKSANAVTDRLQLIGTTVPGGAGKWESHFADFFDDRRVVIVPDNDDAGKKHAKLVAEKIHKTAREVRIVELPDLKDKQDIVDWLDAGNTKVDFERLIIDAPVYNGFRLPLITVRQLVGMNLKVEWLVPELIPVRTGGALVGQAGAGKTWALLDLALAMATGTKWLGKYEVNQGTVVIVDEENALPLISERLVKLARYRKIDLLNSDLPIHLLAGHEVDFTPGTKAGEIEYTQDHVDLIADLRKAGADLVIMDSLTRIHHVDENSATEMSNVFASLKNIIREARCGVMFTHHYNKGEGRSTSNRIRGSSDIRAWCDYALAIESLDKDEAGTLELKITHDKSRYGEQVPTFAVTMTNVWHGNDQAIGFLHRGAAADLAPGRPKKVTAADIWKWIKKQLQDGAMYGTALQTLCGSTDCGFGLTKLNTELSKRSKAGQLIVTKDGRKNIYELAPQSELDEFTDHAAEKGL